MYILNLLTATVSTLLGLIRGAQSSLGQRSSTSNLRNFRNFLFVVPQNKKFPPLPKCSNRISDELCTMLRQGAPGESAQPSTMQESVKQYIYSVSFFAVFLICILTIILHHERKYSFCSLNFTNKSKFFANPYQFCNFCLKLCSRLTVGI